ncbi:hypothetical protein BDF22DRAFT_743105 [Syncephalis plumigaleata]|nr:hypothetical protein BDF22DRAFT_743105 [Syncephalis plumigaleata]
MSKPATEQASTPSSDDNTPNNSERLEFQRGDIVQPECFINYATDVEPTWQPLPICLETHEPFNLEFGNDEMRACTWVMDVKMMAYMARVIHGSKMIQCRLPVNRLDTDRHVTFPLLFNGYFKNKALYLSSNLHMTFHVQNGLIIGGAGYPVPKLNEFYTIMVPVKWYDGKGYINPYTSLEESVRPTGFTADGFITPRLAFFLCLFTLLTTFFVLLGIYTGYLRDAVFEEGRRSVEKEKKE